MKVTRGVKEVTRTGARFLDGAEGEFDSIILATGYKSNVPSWLKVSSPFPPVFMADLCLTSERMASVPGKPDLLPWPFSDPCGLLQGGDLFTKEGLPSKPFPNGWRGENGLYSVGFTMRGLQGTSSDAINIAADISEKWQAGAAATQGGGSSYPRPHCQRPLRPPPRGPPAAAAV